MYELLMNSWSRAIWGIWTRLYLRLAPLPFYALPLTDILCSPFWEGGLKGVYQLQRNHTSYLVKLQGCWRRESIQWLNLRWKNMGSGSRLWNTRPDCCHYKVLERAWEFAQPVLMCFVDLRGVPWDILEEQVDGNCGLYSYQWVGFVLGDWLRSDRKHRADSIFLVITFTDRI